MTTHPTAKIPRGLRVLPPQKKKSLNDEKSHLRQDTAAIEQWWKESRWNHTKRVYSGKSTHTFNGKQKKASFSHVVILSPRTL